MTWAEITELLVVPGLRFTRQSWLKGDLTLILITVLEDDVLKMDGTMYAPPQGGSFPLPTMDPAGPNFQATDSSGRTQTYPKEEAPATDWLLLHDDAYKAWRRAKIKAGKSAKGLW